MFDSNQYSIMSYTSHPKSLHMTVINRDTEDEDLVYTYVEPSTPMLYDIAAIQYLYGKNTTTATGNDTYTFDPSTPFFKCIWDAGGSDTISVSTFTRGCTINLNAGKFSSISIPSDALPTSETGYYDWTGSGNTVPTYDGTNNLSIAFGVTIEKAVGGSGNDRLTGNAAKNTLTGNGGNDIIDGGAGNDVLNGGTGADRLQGGAGNDTLTWDGLDTRADGGAGVDVLKFTTSDLDLTAILNTKIVNIETINMTGSGNNALTLTSDDVLDISSTTNTLKILGNVGDEVRLQTGFIQGATLSGFETWQNGSAIAKISEDVNVVLFS